MPKRLWKYVCVLVGVVVLVIGGYIGAHCYVSAQLQRALPGATYDRLALARDAVYIRDLTFSKGWVRGRLDYVTVTWDRTVRVEGGELWVSLPDRPKGTSSEGASDLSLTASGLKVHAQITPRLTGDFEDCTWSGITAEFRTGTVRQGSVQVDFSQGWFSPARQWVTFKMASTTVGPFEVEMVTIPRLPITMTDISVEVDKRKATIGHLEGGPISATGVCLEQHEIGGYSADADQLRLNFPWLYSDPVTVSAVSASYYRNGDILLNLGVVPVRYSQEDRVIEGDASCYQWLDLLPPEMKVPPFDTLSMIGHLSFEVKLSHPPKFKIKTTCQANCKTLPGLRRPFKYKAYYDQERKDRTSGPGSAEWIPISLMGRVPEYAVRLEDPAFFQHSGVIQQAFENSLIDDLKLGKFHRGGSTITMQLAKNLWLSRDKNLGRKVQEIFLAKALESCYTKDEMLELYLNVVEFGPSIYGLQGGSKHWFEVGPMDLNPVEAFWLASILPRPRTATKPKDFGSARKLIEKLTGEVVSEDVDSIDLSEWVAQ